MHSEIRNILKRSARKLLIIRMCESAAVAATAGGLAASVVLAAVLPVRLWAPGAAALAVPATWAITLIPLAALIGAVVRCAFGVSARDAAVWLDSAGRLKQRLTTAEELLQLDKQDTSAAATVFAQALAALKQSQPQRMPMWRRGRATIAAMCLAATLALTLALIGSTGGASDAQALADALAEMSPAQRQTLIDALKSARQATGAQDARLSASLAEAAIAVELDDNETLADALARARQEGLNLREILPGDLQGLTGAGVGGASKAKPPERTPTPAAITTDVSLTDRQPKVVRVYDRLYPQADEGDKRPTEDLAIAQLDYDQAWSAARRRAMDKLTAGAVPQRYRRILRNFFADR